MRILILGGGLQAISTIQSLRGKGHEIVLMSDKSDSAKYCRGLSKHIALDSNKDTNKKNQNILQHLQQEKYNVIIPMSDVYTGLLVRHRKEIERSSVKCAIPNEEAYEIASDKLRLMKFCKDCNFPHPKTISLDEDHSIVSGANLSTFPFPALIKPNQSVGARGIRKVRNKEEIDRIYPEIKKGYGSCHLQEFLDTNGSPYFNVMMYRNAQGIIIAHTITEIIRYYPLGGGSSSMCVTIENDTLVSICSSVLEQLNYIGFADFDILRDSQGDYKIIEINPRVPASLRAAQVSGINFPEIILEDALGHSIPKMKYHPGKTLRYLGLDIAWFISSKERFRTHPSWFKFWGQDIFYQEGGGDDFRAMIVSLFKNLNKIQLQNGRLKKREELI